MKYFKLFESFVNEAKTPKLNTIDFSKLKKIMLDASDMDSNDESDFDDTIKILMTMSAEFPKGEVSFLKWSSKQNFSRMRFDVKDLRKKPSLEYAASQLEDELDAFDGVQERVKKRFKNDYSDSVAVGIYFNEYVEVYNEIADIVAKVRY